MKRAEVYKLDPNLTPVIADGKVWAAHIRNGRLSGGYRYHTHAEALAHALAEVGLDRPAEHREAP